MKRVLTVLVLLSGAYILHAEEMKFVTTLSSPLGTFAQLETADYSATTSVPLLNFCNTRSSAGTVALKGADTYLQTLSLKNGTTLGGNTPEYRISGTLSVNNNSEVTGGRLLANMATVSGASSAKSKVADTLYMSSMKVKGVKAASLTIPSQVQTSGSGNNDELEWSNVYGRDYKDGEVSGTKTYTSYLLKTKVGSMCPEGKVVENGVCVCANTVEKGLCVGTVECADGSTSMQTWNEDTCQCEDSCPQPSDKEHYFRCSRGKYSWQPLTNTYSSKADAKQACEEFGVENATYYEGHAPTVECKGGENPNKPMDCITIPGWTANWYCTDQNIPCGGGIGGCDPCTCFCGVG